MLHGVKKADARFILPQATSTRLVVTANFREWRHIIKLRTDKHAQWEITELSNRVLNILKKNSCVFNDLGDK